MKQLNFTTLLTVLIGIMMIQVPLLQAVEGDKDDIYQWQMQEYQGISETLKVEPLEVEEKEKLKELEKNGKEDELFDWQMKEYSKLKTMVEVKPVVNEALKKELEQDSSQQEIFVQQAEEFELEFEALKERNVTMKDALLDPQLQKTLDQEFESTK